MYYIIETKKGYIKEPTFIFDKTCEFLTDAYKFKEKELKKFFMFRNKKNYKTYKMRDKQ